MKIKWVCPVCSTTNICEKTERMRCFVCGSYYEEGPHISESSHISESPHLPEGEDLTSADVSAAKPGVREKLNNFIKKVKSSLGLKEKDRPKRKIADWKIGHSSSDSKEAYVEATPIYEEISDRIPEADIEIDRDPTERIGESEHLVKRSSEIFSERPSADVRSFTPWPEHRIVFDMEKLNATGCVNVERTEVSGSKYYKLTYRNGTERIMNISNLKMVGYARDM